MFGGWVRGRVQVCFTVWVCFIRVGFIGVLGVFFSYFDLSRTASVFFFFSPFRIIFWGGEYILFFFPCCFFEFFSVLHILRASERFFFPSLVLSAIAAATYFNVGLRDTGDSEEASVIGVLPGMGRTGRLGEKGDGGSIIRFGHGMGLDGGWRVDWVVQLVESNV